MNRNSQTNCLCIIDNNEKRTDWYYRVKEQFKNFTFGSHLERIKNLLINWLGEIGEIRNQNGQVVQQFDNKYLSRNFEYRIKPVNADGSI